VFRATSCINKLILSSERRRAVLDMAGVVLVMPDVAPAATMAPLPAEPQELPATTRALSQLIAPVLPNNCTAPDRFPVESPRRCDSHGLTARVWLELIGLQQENVVDPASPRRTISPMASPEYTPTSPEHIPTPVEPPIFPIRRTMAARSGDLPYYNSTGGLQ
jgi:hypothetical protein